MDSKDVQDNRIMAILAYINILFLVPLLAAKDSPFARFHTNQGFLLFIVEVGIYIIGLIFPIMKFLTWILSIVALVLAVMGIINAYQGEKKELPIIGKYKILS